MVRPIMRDIFFLRQKAQPATKEDKQIVQDLLDTLKANEAGCVGMAANMIGCKYGIYQCGNAESGDSEKVRSIRDRGGMSFS